MYNEQITLTELPAEQSHPPCKECRKHLRYQEHRTERDSSYNSDCFFYHPKYASHKVTFITVQVPNF